MVETWRDSLNLSDVATALVDWPHVRHRLRTGGRLLPTLSGKPCLGVNGSFTDFKGELQREARVVPYLAIFEARISEDLFARVAPGTLPSYDNCSIEPLVRWRAVLRGDCGSIDAVAFDD